MKSLDIFEQHTLKVAQILKSLSHPKRLLILCKLTSTPKSVGELEKECSISQSQLSQFLGKMKEEGIVESKKIGLRVIYSIADPDIQKLLQSLASIYCPTK